MDSVFPVIIHRFQSLRFESLKNELIKSAYTEKENDPKGTKKSNLGGWQSDDISKSNNIIVGEVFGSIINYFDSNNILVKDSSLKVTNIWVNINRKGNSNIKHNHPGADLSGVFWIKSPENCGMLNFQSPYTYNGCKTLLTMNPEIKNKFAAWELIKYPPKEGDICIFPAFFEHWVEENQSDEDRISVSFNVELIPPPYIN